MKKYIQRAQFKNPLDETKKGVDQILYFEYMGYSEYEYDLTKSIHYIREHFTEYKLETISVNDEIVCVFARKSEMESAIQNIVKDAFGKLQTKGATQFDLAILRKTDTRVWWNIYDHYIYFIEEDFDLRDKLLAALAPPETKKSSFWDFLRFKKQ